MKITSRLAMAVLCALTLAALGLICLAVAASHPARAAAPAIPPARLFLPSDIFTDTYEINDSQPSAYFVGTVNQSPCTNGVGQQVIHDATFWRDGLSNPAFDVDWYRIQLNPTLNYTFTVNQQVPSNVQFSINLIDSNNNTIFAQSNLNSATIPFNSATGGSFYLQISASNASSITGTENKPYQAFICSSNTLITPTPLNQPTPAGLAPDNYEPNNTITDAMASVMRSTGYVMASFIQVGQRIDDLNFASSNNALDTADWYEFYGRAGSIYQITTLNVNAGVETVLYVYTPDKPSSPDNPVTKLVAPLPGYTNPNNRFQAGLRGSQVTFQVGNGGDGLYWIKVVNSDPSPRLPGQTYSLQVQEVLQAATAGPSPTPETPGPTGTPFPGQIDKYEYNGDYDHAYLIAPDAQYDDINFVPFQPYSINDVNNDFFRLPVKQGIYYTCQTLNLAPGTDTNLIVYNQDRVGIGGNDDISTEETQKGNFASRFAWLSSYTGWAYVLVGPVNPPKANEAGGTNYSLRCDIGLPTTPTPTGAVGVNPSATFVPASPLAPEPTMTPYPTPRSAQNLPVRQINIASPTPTPQPAATPRSVTLSVQVFNDLNSNGLLDPGEGIYGVSVRLSDEDSGVPLAQGLTDVDGRLSLTVMNPGPVRLSVPLFGYSELVLEDTSTVRIAIVSSVTLPDRIP